ncbi:FAD-dependent oxidoreductase [Oceanobacillus sp. CAU 1775]
MKIFDYIIIGFGKGGKTLAKDLAQQGKSVAMIEESNKMYGGTCINIACIPTKYLIHQAQEKSENEDASDFYKQAIENKNNVTAKLREANYKNLEDEEAVTIYTAKASFLSDKHIQLKSATETMELAARHFIINTGSKPVIPPIKGIEESQNIYTSTELQEVTELPEELIIAGGGYIGLEFASLYEALGSKVTIIDSSDEFMKNEDRDIAESVKKTFIERNIKIIPDSKVTAVADKSKGIHITYENSSGQKNEITGSALLLATGRKPNTGDLDLDKAGIKLDDKGAIVVDANLKTSVEHIWAVGDVNGGPQFTYISLDDYRILRDQIFGEGTYTLDSRKNVPYSVFIEPPLSHVGLNEKTAKEENIDYQVVTMPAAAIPRTKINKQPTGLLKALIDPSTKEILGCTLFCAASSEMINIVRVAIEAKLPYTFLRDNIFTHPTMSEGLNDLFKKFD